MHLIDRAMLTNIKFIRQLGRSQSLHNVGQVWRNGGEAPDVDAPGLLPLCGQGRVELGGVEGRGVAGAVRGVQAAEEYHENVLFPLSSEPSCKLA